MPILYLSPSTQEYNPYVNGGNEEQYMSLSGTSFSRPSLSGNTRVMSISLS